jgi:hypothetical protein
MSINNDKYLPHRLTGVPPLRVFSLSLSLYLEMIFKFKQKKKILPLVFLSLFVCQLSLIEKIYVAMMIYFTAT